MKKPTTRTFSRTFSLPFSLSLPLTAALLAGCGSLTPRYDTPAAAVPPTLPLYAPAAPASAAEATVPVATAWQTWVADARLREVIGLALEHNRDLRSAVLAVEQARATYRIQEAAVTPTLNANAGLNAVRTPGEATNSGLGTLSRTYSVGLGLASYELDFFGRVHSLRDAALASFLATEVAQRSTRLSLIAEVSTAWLTLGADQRQLALARRTLASQQQTYALTQKRQALGAVSGLVLAQTRTTVEAARGNVAAYESQVQRDRHALELLLGRSLPAQLLPPGAEAEPPATALVAVPPDLPSSVLQQRPDVLAAEQQLKAANANIGVARAARFPRISLTASAGTASRSLEDLFKGGAWSFVPTLSWPIFDGGASESTLRLAELTREQRLAAYDKAVQTAFREVADALSVRASLAERLAAQRALVEATQQTLTLAEARFKAGADTYLAVLDAQRSLYAAQQALITLELAEQANRVTLYKVLVGG